MSLRVGASEVRLQSHMRYLGLKFDGEWRFREHFAAVAKKADVRANTLVRLLPNIGGPSSRVRRLYANTVCAVALYGAPVWAGDLAADKKSQAVIASSLRPAATRIVRCYRMVSHTATTVLAGIPHLDMQILEYKSS